MTTLAQVNDSHLLAPKHRFALRDLVRVDEGLASAEDMVLVKKLRAAATPADLDAIIHELAINRLFVRGVLYIGDKK